MVEAKGGYFTANFYHLVACLCGDADYIVQTLLNEQRQTVYTISNDLELRLEISV